MPAKEAKIYTEANQNFSKVVRMVDEADMVLQFHEYDEYQTTSIIEENIDALIELAEH